MTTDTQKLATTIRGHALRMIAKAKASHVGSCLSMADLLAVLYGSVLRVDPANPQWPMRDRLVVSKGHGAAILYAVLAERGFFPVADLMTYSQDGSPLTGHVSHHVPGVELSTGSLGHGLPVGCGLALAHRRPHAPREDTITRSETPTVPHTYVILSDGELDEGSNWEAILFAGHHKLDSLTAIVDYNKVQSFGSVKDVLDLEPLGDKWRSFGWQVHQIDGHDHDAIQSALAADHTGKPKVIIAHTIKGKGVAYMEGQLAWHYKSPDAKQLADALLGLECGQ
ncbi:MAG: transketolase [Planctomycetes bacterium]|nr:transketolase [Planctomycetota bacterium]